MAKTKPFRNTIAIVTIALSILIAGFLYTKTTKPNTFFSANKSCSHQKVVCRAIVIWPEYSHIKDYATTYQMNMPSGEKNKIFSVRRNGEIARNQLFINNTFKVEAIYTKNFEYRKEAGNDNYVTKKTETFLNENDTVGYSLTSPSQKLTAFIMENSHLFSFQDLGKEDCVDSTCKKFQVTQTTNTTPQDLINNGLDQYSAENLKLNDIYLWIDLNTYRVHRIRSEYQNTYHDLTYDYNPPQINIPQ